MNIGKKRSVFGRAFGRSGDRSARRLVQVSGAARDIAAARPWDGMERLEDRVLLYGDHVAMPVPFNAGAGTVVDISSGTGTVNGVIQAPGTTGPGGTVPGSGDNDFFKFTTANTDFVRVLARTVNGSGVFSGLNSQVRIFNSAGLVLNKNGQFVDPATAPAGSLQGDDNGVLSTTRPSVATDGWAGFVSQPGQTYFVRVTGQSGSTGTYTLSVGAQTNVIVPDPASGEVMVPPELAPPPPFTPPIPELLFPEDEVVWTITTPNDPIFNSVATVTAAAFRTNAAGFPPVPAAGPVDTHIEVYDAQGRLLTSDIESGFLNDAFATFKASPNSTYYIRVRGDDLRNPALFTSTGPFQLRVDMSARELDTPVDPVTRRGFDTTRALLDPAWSELFRFQAQGTGLAFVTAVNLSIFPSDVSIRVFDENGAFIAFNDDFNGTEAQLQVPVVGGKTYFVVVDGFDDVGSQPFGLWVEAHHTFDPNVPVDDHVPSRPATDPLTLRRRAFELATPIQFGDPHLLLDADGNPIRDRSYVVDGVGTGRVFTQNDSDLFMVTPQVDMLSDYAGNNDDAGLALFLGGAFTVADPDDLVPVTSRSLTPWDAGDFWFTGPQGPTGQPAPADRFGLGDGDPNSDNPDIPNIPGTNTDQGGIIYAMQVWQPAGFPRPLLFVGGDFSLVLNTDQGPQVVSHNIAAWGFDPLAGRYVWFPLADVDAPVRAMTVYDAVSFDPDGSEPGAAVDDPALESLILGGDFTSIDGVAFGRIAGFNLFDGFFPLGAGASNGSVRALAVFDPEDPGDARAAQTGPPALTAVRDLPDPPRSLWAGGTFTNMGGTGQGQLARWDGLAWHRPNFAPVGTVPGPGLVTFNGPNPAVNALHVYTEPDAGGGSGSEPRLYIAGTFTSVTVGATPYGTGITFGGYNVPSANIIRFGRKATTEAGDANVDQAVNAYFPRLLYEAVGTGTNNTIWAMTTWDAPDVAGPDSLPPMLVVGGDFTTANGAPANRLAAWDGAWGAFDFGPGADGSVRALQAIAGDEQEPGIPLLGNGFPPASDPQEVLYFGGTFSDPGANIAQVAFDPNGPFGPGFYFTELNSGVNAGVFSLAAFDDQNPQFDNSGSQWDRNDRIASRMQVVVTPTTDSFLNTFIRVYDSNLELVYTNETIAPPPFTDPSGMVDPSTAAAGAGGNQITGIEVWGGEVYYIEVIASPQFGGTGRYTVTVRVDGFPPDLDGDGLPDDVISTITEVPNEGQFAAAPPIDRNLATGDGRNFVPGNLAAHNVRTSQVTPSRFQTRGFGELAALEHIEDTDLYSFIAEESGWVSVRITTTLIGDDPTTEAVEGDEFFERETDFNQTPPAITDRGPKIKARSSWLDSMLRVFSNDFIQIALNDNNPAVTGEFDTTFIGTAERTFYHRDPMVMFRVERGRKYYIQVESSQRALKGSPDEDKIDWRTAIGAYELLVDTMPNLNFDDDHADNVLLGTPIPVGLRDPILELDSPNGQATVTGVIDNTLQNIDDQDAFYVFAPTKGPVTVTVTSAGGGAGLRAQVTVTDINGQAIATGASNANGVATLNWVAQQGELYDIVIDGIGASEGAYTLTYVGAPFVDDQPRTRFDPDPEPNGSFLGNQWLNATPLVVNRFFGQAVFSGKIEDAGDTDMFVYTSETYEVATVTLQSSSASLDPIIRVFEVNEDGAGNPVFMQISFNDNAAGGGNNSRATFSMTAGRPYYFLVAGVEAFVDSGSYTLTLQVAPTDDHPNTTDRPVATPIPIAFDSLTGIGLGSKNGLIERTTDNDLFTFTAPATGGYSIEVTTPGSGLAPRVSLLRANGSALRPAVDGTLGSVDIGDTSGLVAGQQYFIVVEPGTSSDGQEPDLTGSYTVRVTTLPQDDHPNAGQFGLVTANDRITLAAGTGIGLGSGVIVPFSDTDLFWFTTLAAGPTVVQLTTPTSAFNGQIRVFNSLHQQIGFNAGDADTALVSFVATGANETYYILVERETGASGSAITGAYSLRVTGPTGGGGPGPGPGPADDHPNSGDFSNATVVNLDTRTGDGNRSGVINFLGDTDLFTFITPSFVNPRTGNVFIQVTTPGGTPLDASVRIFDVNFNEIRFDALGIPGATAATSFTTTGGEQFFALVEQVGSNTGPYVLRVDAEPELSRLYYPEGFAGSTINEFVPIVNTNPFPVRIIAAIAHYEFDPANPDAPRDQVLALTDGEKFIPANSRGGFTVSTKDNLAASLVQVGRPYSLEIIADAPLGATFSHYDFGVTVGESFTDRVSTTWTFAEARRDPAKFRDFLVFFNPNDSTATITVTLTYDDGTVATFSRALDGQRRGGVNLTEDGAVPKDGVFSVKVTSDVPIVAALSSYDYVNGRGDGWLGDANGGSTEGVFTSVTTGSGVEGLLSAYNDGDTSATITFRATYTRVDLPEMVKVITLAPKSRVSLTLAQLGLVDSQQAGLRYSSTLPVTVNLLTYRNGDGDAAPAGTDAATTAIIGDAFVNPAAAGILYIEELSFYNPAAQDVNVTITFLFTDGTSAAQTINIAPDGFASLRIDQQPAILNRIAATAFSIRMDALTPFVASFTHYDLFLNGGWRALAAPIGLTNPIATI